MPGMGIEVTLWRGDGRRLTGLPDPSGGTFDAAGDFDSLLDSSDLPVLGSIDPYGETTLNARHAAGLIREVDSVLDNPRGGPEARGLRRLRAMAEMCQTDQSLTLRAVGD
jgi:hypothetical protein